LPMEWYFSVGGLWAYVHPGLLAEGAPMLGGVAVEPPPPPQAVKIESGSPQAHDGTRNPVSPRTYKRTDFRRSRPAGQLPG
jgi:hypothetical protein